MEPRFSSSRKCALITSAGLRSGQTQVPVLTLLLMICVTLGKLLHLPELLLRGQQASLTYCTSR